MFPIRIIIDLCLFRARPQDLPVSTALVWVTAAVWAAIGTAAAQLGDASLTARETVDEATSLLRNVADIASHIVLYAGVIWAALNLAGKRERFRQTATAQFGINAVFGLIMLPVTPALVELMRKGRDAQFGWEAYFAIAVGLWSFVVMARIMQEAFEVTAGKAAMITIACVLLPYVPLFLLVALTSSGA